MGYPLSFISIKASIQTNIVFGTFVVHILESELKDKLKFSKVHFAHVQANHFEMRVTLSSGLYQLVVVSA